MMKTNKARPVNKKQAELLYLLMEEAGEVIQAASKTLRHGLDSRNPHQMLGPTNQSYLEKEVGQFQCAVVRLYQARVLNEDEVTEHQLNKMETGKQYLRHS